MIILLAFAFLAGIVTILSPCILPILPIVLSGSVGGSKKKPLGIILGFILSFTFFTLFLTTLVKLTGISPNVLRYGAAAVLLLFGASLLIPQFQLLTEKLFTKLSAFAPKANPNAGFLGGFIIGLSIGLIWVPCVGPILASVIALAALSKVTIITFLITFAYALGSGIPMFFIMIGGRKLLDKVPALVQNGGTIQKVFGVLMILLAFMIYFNLDQKFEGYIASTPYGANLTRLEQNDLVTKQLDVLKGRKTASSTVDSSGLFNANMPAPDFVGINKWLNPEKPLHIADLKGKVVLIDFWTYTCINCIRTLPHVTSWYDKYKDQGFVVIGVHTPEFQFEHDTNNVRSAIKQYNIHYPVAQDNDYATWNAYSNQFWPAEYLIDAKGIIRRTHFGEGEYDMTEQAIQSLLKENGKKVNSGLYTMVDQTPTTTISPESYLGVKRMLYEVPEGKTALGTQTFSMQKNIPHNNHFSFGGTWNIANEYATAEENARLTYAFTAGRVFLVMRPSSTHTGTVRVLLDGKQIPQSIGGKDVKNGIVTVDADRLYDIVNLHGKTERHLLQLQFQTIGLSAYVFTFGS